MDSTTTTPGKTEERCKYLTQRFLDGKCDGISSRYSIPCDMLKSMIKTCWKYAEVMDKSPVK